VGKTQRGVEILAEVVITPATANAVALRIEVERHTVGLAVAVAILGIALLEVAIAAHRVTIGKTRVLVTEIHAAEHVVVVTGGVTVREDDTDIGFAQHIGGSATDEYRL